MTAVYRDLDLDEVCEQYLPSLRTPEWPQFIDAYLDLGVAARRAVPTERVSYGEHPDEWMWYSPGPDASAPLVVFLHGGYWHLLSADDGSLLAPAARASGCAFASVNYTLCPAASLERLIEQVGRAIDSLVAKPHATHDPRQVHVMGHSAGAHLAASVALREARVAGWVFVSGVFDIRPIVHIPDNHDVGLTSDSAARLSPLLHLASAVPAPAVVTWGGLESTEFARQSREWASAWGPRARLHEATGRHHFDVLFDVLDPSTEVGAAVLAQVVGHP